MAVDGVPQQRRSPMLSDDAKQGWGAEGLEEYPGLQDTCVISCMIFSYFLDLL